ncbi:MAG: HEAT repeat domain-containing protein, partial [Planctomycetota bacterium]
PSYYIDCLPGVMKIGRGSPNWGIFYEHTQLPEAYRDSFIACDYLWKSATSGGYANPGRLCVFHMKRNGATWAAKMTVLAQAKRDAKDEKGQKINFALVDVDVAPDGSLVLTDHNQGVWRIFYDPTAKPSIPPIVPNVSSPASSLEALLELPQPMSEWCRVREAAAKKRIGDDIDVQLREAVLDEGRAERLRHRALRLLSANFAEMSGDFLKQLSRTKSVELRGQAAWLMSIRGDTREVPELLRLLEDPYPFVRRRAAEALMRFGTSATNSKLIALLDDDDRFVRYAAMTALAHRPTDEFVPEALQHSSPRVWMRALVAGRIRRDDPEPEHVQNAVARILKRPPQSIEGKLDFLRILGMFRSQVSQSEELAAKAKQRVLARYPDGNRDLRWERARILGEYQVTEAFPKLLMMLEIEKDHVTQFHLADMMSNLPEGWNEDESRRFATWLASTQKGWFSQFQGKGLQFKGFWGTVLNRIARYHADGLGGLADRVVPGSQLSGHILTSIRRSNQAGPILVRLYKNAKNESARRSVLEMLRQSSHPEIGKLLFAEWENENDAAKKRAFLSALCSQPLPRERSGIFVDGLFEKDARLVEACANRLARDGRRIGDYAETIAKISDGKRKGERAVYHRILDRLSDDPTRSRAYASLLSSLSGTAPTKLGTVPLCLWTSDAQTDERAWFTGALTLSSVPAKAVLHITCDNVFTAWINGKEVASGSEWSTVHHVEVQAHLKSGKNILAVAGENQGGPGGLMAVVEFSDAKGRSLGLFATDESWQMIDSPPPTGWKTNGAAKGPWRPALDVSKPTSNVTNLFKRFLPEAGATLGQSLAAMEFWQAWYLKTFDQPYVPPVPVKQKLLSDKRIRALIAGTKTIEGNAQQGRLAYLKAGCFACHGGIENKET